MKSLLYLILLFALCDSNVLAQTRRGRELPVIADAACDVAKEMFKNPKAKSIAFVQGDEAWNTEHGDLHCTGAVYSIVPTVPGQYYGPVYVGGAFDSIDGIRLRGIAHLDYGSFTEIGGGVSGGAVYAIYGIGDTVYAAGNFKQAGTTAVNNIAMWDGSSWHSLGTGTDSTVLALCMYEGRLYAGGNFRRAGDSLANYIAYWDIQNKLWHPVVVDGINGMDGGVAVLASRENTLFAGGGFVKAGNTIVNKVVSYYNKTWHDVAGGVTGTNAFVASLALAAWSDNFFLCGSFDTAGGISANNIAEFSSDNWEPLGAGLDGPGYAITMLFQNEWIAVGGEFAHVDGEPANNIAMWNWHWEGAFGSGLDRPVYALEGEISIVAFQPYSLPFYVGGEFTTAGAKSSPNFAIYYFPSGSVASDESDVNVTIKPNPATAFLTIDANMPIASVAISDALGRILETQSKNGTTYQLNLQGYANGIYYCIIESENGRTIEKVIVNH